MVTKIKDASREEIIRYCYRMLDWGFFGQYARCVFCKEEVEYWRRDANGNEIDADEEMIKHIREVHGEEDLPDKEPIVNPLFV